VERWVTGVNKASCAGCIFLSRAGPFPLGQAPRPPLHGNCGCSIERIDLTGFSPEAVIALGMQARKNRRDRERLLVRATRLRNSEHTALGKELGPNRSGRTLVGGRRSNGDG
jgi:hypothetical protein